MLVWANVAATHKAELERQAVAAGDEPPRLQRWFAFGVHHAAGTTVDISYVELISVDELGKQRLRPACAISGPLERRVPTKGQSKLCHLDEGGEQIQRGSSFGLQFRDVV